MGCSIVQDGIQRSKTFEFSKKVLINYEVIPGGDSGRSGAEGKNRCVLLLHGFAASSQNWNDIKHRFPGECTVYLPDLKGFGFSSKPDDGEYSPRHHAEIITAFIRSLGLSNLVLAGHSYGGALALLSYFMLSERHPSLVIDGLILVSSAGYRQKMPFYIGQLRKRPRLGSLALGVVPARILMKRSLLRAYRDPSSVTREKINRYTEAFDLPGARQGLVWTAQQIIPPDLDRFIRRFRDVSIPVLIIWGRNDRIIPLEYGYKFEADIPGARLHILDNCGHIPQEEKPLETMGIIHEFLDSLDTT